MRFPSRFPVRSRTLEIFLLASLLGGTTLSAASIGTVLSGSYSLTQDIQFGYIVYDGTSGGNSTVGVMSVGTLDSTAGAAVNYSYTLPIDLGTGPIALMGIDTTGGVVLTVNNSVSPSYVAAAWPYQQDETQIEADLKTGNGGALVSFLQAHSGDFFYAPATTQANFLAFSNGLPIGMMSLTATAIPEPSNVFLVLIGLLWLAWMVIVRRPNRREL